MRRPSAATGRPQAIASGGGPQRSKTLPRWFPAAPVPDPRSQRTKKTWREGLGLETIHGVNFAPIIERELRLLSRQRFLCFARSGTAGCAALIASGLMFFGLGVGASPAELGRNLFLALAVMLFAGALFAGPVLTADCLSEERRNGTLAFLFLANLRGADIVAGKLVALALPAVQCLLAVIPILGMAFFLGGVTGGELARVTLILTETLFFSLTAALAVSAVSRNGMRAVSGSVFVVLLVTLGLPGWAALHAGGRGDGISALSPLTGLLLARDADYASASHVFWESAAGLLAIGIGCLTFAVWRLPCVWLPEVAVSGVQLRTCFQRRDSAARTRQRQRQALDSHPFVWLAGRKRVSAAACWVLIATALLVCAWAALSPGQFWFRGDFLFATFYALHLALKVVVAWDASRRFAEDRDSGALELLLCTPVAEHDIWHGWLIGLKRTYVGPLFTLGAIEFGLLVGGLTVDGWWFGQGIWGAAFAAGLLLFLADLYTLSWMGLWQGLVSRNSTRACLRTMGWILLAPGALFLGGLGLVGLAGGRMGMQLEPFLLGWFGLGLMVDLAGCGYAMLKLNEEFRAVVAQIAGESDHAFAKLGAPRRGTLAAARKRGPKACHR